MTITLSKKEFLKKISGGIRVLMAISYTADELAIHQCDEIEEYIAEHLLVIKESAIGIKRAWFSESKFDKFIDTADDKTVKDLLLYLDNIDLCLYRVFEEASLHPDDFSQNEKIFAELINDDGLHSFKDFIDY